MNLKKIQIQVCVKINKTKLPEFSKFKMLFALKLHFNWGNFYTETSKFGYFKNLEKIIIKLQWLRKLTAEMI